MARSRPFKSGLGRRERAGLVVLLVAAIGAFLPAAWAGFVADDFVMLGTLDAVGHPLDAFARNDLGQDGGAGHFYRPLWVLANDAIGRLFNDSAGAFHVFNLVLFAVTVLEVWMLARATVGPTRAWVAAGLFGLYPRHGESVAWISGSTDLLATAFALAAVLALLAPWPTRLRLGLAVLATTLAALSKESAFVLPLLALLVLTLSPARATRPMRWLRWRAPAAMAAALLCLFVVRTAVIGGAGGYAEEPLSPARIIVSAVSYVLAGITPHELELLRHPVLLVIPLVVLGLLAWGALRLRGRGDKDELRVLALGAAWFAVALVPVLGYPLDLNNATGERLLFLPSVGLAIAIAALLPTAWRPRLRAGLALGGAGLLALCLVTAASWQTASDIAARVARQAAALSAGGEEVVALSFPESYRNAHVFTNGLQQATMRAGGRAVRIRHCVPVHVRDERRRQVRFSARAPGAFDGSTTWAAPFDFPLRHDGPVQGAGCTYVAREQGSSTLGLKLGAVANPAAPDAARVLAVFDGRDLVELSGSDPSAPRR